MHEKFAGAVVEYEDIRKGGKRRVKHVEEKVERSTAVVDQISCEGIRLEMTSSGIQYSDDGGEQEQAMGTSADIERRPSQRLLRRGRGGI